MKKVLTIFLLTLSVSCFGQIYGWMLMVDPGQDADTSNIAVTYPNGNGQLSGRVHYVSYQTVLQRLIAFSPDTVYVNTGDSLVIVSIHGDTTYFGGGAGITDGDKGDITVSLGGTVWTIDNGLAATKIADGTVSNAEFQYIGGLTSDAQTQLNNKAASGANTDINSVVLDNTGLKIKDGTKNLTISSQSGLSANRTLTIDVNNLNQTLNLEAGLHVVGAGPEATIDAGASVSGSNTGDQDLSSYAADANVVHKTGDETIAGEKTFNDSLRVDDYALFKGLDGGLATKIEMLKEGVLQFDQDDADATGRYLIKSKPLQQTEGNTGWNFTTISQPNAGIDRNNDVFSMGWNLNPGGGVEVAGEVGFGQQFESFYRTSGSDYAEWHIVHIDESGVVRKPITWFLNHYDPALWTGDFLATEIQFNDPTNNAPFAELERGGTTSAYFRMLGSGSGNGAQFALDDAADNLQITSYGMTNPHMYLFDNTAVSYVHMNYLEFLPSGNPATTIVGRGSDNLTTTLTYPVLADSLETYLPSSSDHDWYEVGGTSPPNAITDNIFHTGHVGIGINSPDTELHIVGPSADIGTGDESLGRLILEGDATNALHFGNAASAPYGSYIQSGDRNNPGTQYGIYLNPLGGGVAIGNQDPQQTLHVTGTARITGSSGTALAPAGRDADGDVSAMTEGWGINYASGAIVVDSSQVPTPYDLTSKLNISDTSAMLSHFIERGDTATMLSHYIDRSSAENISGVKTFTSDPIVPAETYGSGWNGSNEPPTKNDLYDKIETLGGGSSDYVISPSQITSDQDNYNPTGFGKATFVRLSGDNGIRAITSVVDSTGGAHTKTIINLGSYAVYFPMDHPDGTAANRFTGLGGDYYLMPGQSAKIWYDATSSRWRFIDYLNIDAGPTHHGQYYFAPAGSATAGDVDIIGYTAIGTGSLGVVSATSVSPSYWQMNTGASETNGYNLNMGKAGIRVGYTGSSAMTAEAQVFYTALSDATDTYQSQISITASPTNATNTPNNTVGIRYSHGINSGKFEGFSIDGAAGTSSVDLGVTVAINTLYVLRVELDKSLTEARFYINGAYVGRLTSNLPANAQSVGTRFLHLKSVGTNGRVSNVSYMLTKSIYP